MFGEQKNLLTFAFDGIHRAGKGTQIELLKNKLQEIGLPCISIRGEGYRSGLGNSPDNPETDFWKKMSEQLKTGEDLNLWDEASYRLARELVVWRDRILSKEIDKTLSPFGVLLVDRSFISKSVLKTVQSDSSPLPPEKIFSSEELYPALLQKHKKITIDMVLPDIIFELTAPKETLLSRLNPDDPDYDFRKKNIEDSYEIYLDAKQHLPQNIKDIIITIDSSDKPEEINQKVIEEINSRFPELKIKNSHSSEV